MHSRYLRHLGDLPWQGRVGQVDLQVRRFRCSASACPRRIFAEQLPAVAAPRVRRTARLAEAQRRIALSVRPNLNSAAAQVFEYKAGNEIEPCIVVPTARFSFSTEDNCVTCKDSLEARAVFALQMPSELDYQHEFNELHLRTV